MNERMCRGVGLTYSLLLKDFLSLNRPFLFKNLEDSNEVKTATKIPLRKKEQIFFLENRLGLIKSHQYCI